MTHDPRPPSPEAEMLQVSDFGPEFALSTWIDETDRDEVELMIHHTEEPSAAKPASNALLYGLAIMTLDQQGVISNEIDKLCLKGVPNEAEVCRQIKFLLESDANDQPV